MSLRAPVQPVKSARAETLAFRQLAGRDRADLERSILSRPDIRAVDRSVLAAIFDRCRGKAVCWPGNASLATEAGVCPRTVPNALARLEGLGIIRTVDDSRVRSRRRIILLKHPDAVP